MERSNWLIFSAIVLVLAGIMRILDAIWAFRYNGPVVDNLHDAIFGHSLTTYGWIWLLVGIVLIASGFLVASNMTLGSPSRAVDRHRGGRDCCHHRRELVGVLSGLVAHLCGPVSSGHLRPRSSRR